ncbi:MAG: hypothetical protein HWE24_14155 [Oceanospirillaceae bacterium]|nr:hypothetical protein [Oceanospirillaceae bacterium]
MLGPALRARTLSIKMEWIFWTVLAVSLIFHSEVSDLINALAERARERAGAARREHQNDREEN